MNASPFPTLPPSLAAPSRHARILFLQVKGGYLDRILIIFAAHMSCIIGGKGSGKTTIFELLRFVFGATFLIGQDGVRSLLKKNLGTGFVRAGYETKHGVRYIVERRLGEDQPRYFTWEGEPVKLGAGIELIECYGQDEIERVGEDRPSQRRLVDRLARHAIAPLIADVAQVTVQLNEGATALLALEAEITTLESSAAEARAIEEQLKPLLAGTGPDAANLTVGHANKARRGREKQAMTTADAVLTETRTSVARLAATLKTKLVSVVTDDMRGGMNGPLVADLDAGLAKVAAAVEALSQAVAAAAGATQGGIEGWRTTLAVAHAAQDAAYDALVSLQKEDDGKTQERARLQERLAVVAGAIPLLDERMRTHTGLRQAQDALADRLLEIRDLRSAARTAVKEKHKETLKRDGVRFEVRIDKELDAYRALLREALGPISGNQPKWLIDRIAPSIRPDELVAIVRAQDSATLTKRAGLDKHPERPAQIIAALTPNRYLYALQSVAIDDEVIIETRHGKVWKDTVECSPGQRSGAILPLLLLEGDVPLAIDQPDDNVDPAFMCDSILPRIVDLRGERQFVFVTHHANVPIVSGADQVVLIESNGTSAELEAEGAVAPMKGHLLSRLEGGSGAFELRKRTYEDDAATPPVRPESDASG